jgi:hypothetical protein
MSEVWNPTITKPNGEPVAFENPGEGREYQDGDVLRMLVGYGCLTKEIAAGYGVTPSTIRRQLRNKNIQSPGKRDPRENNYECTRAVHDAGGIEWHTHQNANGGNGRVERQASEWTMADAFQYVICRSEPCPDCGRNYDTAKAQHDCMRSHARGLASYLAGQANTGNEVLELNASE